MRAPYGCWPSPITAELVGRKSISFDAVQLLGPFVFWLERRPEEGGRHVLVRWSLDRGHEDAVPAHFDVGSRVNEYGGGAYLPSPAGVFASNSADDRVYLLRSDRLPQPVTRPGAATRSRYADLRLSPDGRMLVCVRERMEDGKVVNELVALSADGSREPWALARGHDFFSSPRFSRDGKRLAWTTSDLPNMPWDGTRLWVADVRSDGRLGTPQLVAGGRDESVFQPEWSADGHLHFVSDRTGWWNLYRLQAGRAENLLPMRAEFGEAQWEFDYATYALLDHRRIACRYRRGVTDRVTVLDTETGRLVEVDLPVRSVKPYVRGLGDRLALIGSSPLEMPKVLVKDLVSQRLDVVAGSDLPVGPSYISVPEEFVFETDDGTVGHGLYYPPTNPDVEAPFAGRPPLIVQPHPGPTDDAKPRLDLRVQYFTSRGFAVAAVNYRGSTGYGRDYRESLVGRWGEIDAADCIAAARHLIRGKGIDPRRVVISGASAGGFTALNAASSGTVFAAAVSAFGITDLEAHREESGRFQGYKLDRLVGPYPDSMDEFRHRSPINRASRIRCPVLLMHGVADTVVPPSHSRSMADALRAAGVPYGHYEFAGEGHGFTKSETVERSLQLELAFYGATLGLPLPPDQTVPLRLWNRAALEETRSMGL